MKLWKVFGRIMVVLAFLLISNIAASAQYTPYSYWPGPYGDYRYTNIVYQPYIPYYGGFSPFGPVYYHYSYRFYSSDPFYRDGYYPSSRYYYRD